MSQPGVVFSYKTTERNITSSAPIGTPSTGVQGQAERSRPPRTSLAQTDR
jgi:hypothetical protein